MIDGLFMEYSSIFLFFVNKMGFLGMFVLLVLVIINFILLVKLVIRGWNLLCIKVNVLNIMVVIC